MIKTFIILSAPSTASSLVAEGLASKIYMGNDIDNKNGHFENPMMVILSQEILARARKIDKVGPLLPHRQPRRIEDPWDNPPSEQAILNCAPHFAQKIKNIIASQSSKAIPNQAIKNASGYAGRPSKCWGWKDGRIGLILPIIAPYLENPHYLFLRRDPEETAQAITRRMVLAGLLMPIEDSRAIIAEYHRRILKFLT